MSPQKTIYLHFKCNNIFYHINERSHSKIGRFKIEDIINAENESSVYPDYESTNEFYGYTITSFTVLPDQKTLIGIDCVKNNILIIEDITDESSKGLFHEHLNTITNIIYNETTESLLVGDNMDTVVQ